MRVCFIRLDKIGDLVLTLPVQYLWKSKRPQDQCSWYVSKGLEFVINAWDESEKNVFFLGKPEGILSQFKSALGLSEKLKSYEKIVFFHVPWWVAFAAWLARVPDRVGIASQWYSWLFFNRRLRQKRSQAQMHEAEYNRALVLFALSDYSGDAVIPLPLVSTPMKKVDSYVVIHPGMAGSARNWPAENYRKLGAQLLEQGISVIVTGADGDKAFILETGLLDLPGIQSQVGATDGTKLLQTLAGARAVVAPSTGVAHLAASLGVKTIGIYSPVRVQAPKRWRPLGKQVFVHVPGVDCPGGLSCLGSSCPLYDCMSQISVDAIVQDVIRNGS